MASKKTADNKNKALNEKKKKLVTRKKNLKKLENRLKNVDKELVIIEKELRTSRNQRSRVVDEDLRNLETKLLHLDVAGPAPEKGELTQSFYRHFVFKCKKCQGEFDRNISISPIQKNLVCPACGKDHSLGLYPSSRFYHVSHSKDIEIKNTRK